MDSDDANFYLRQGFNPNSLTKAQLTKILIAHDAPFNSNSKKGELLQAFHENITVKRTQLLERAEVQPSGSGIVNVESKAPPQKRSSKKEPREQRARTVRTRSMSPEKEEEKKAKSSKALEPAKEIGELALHELHQSKPPKSPRRKAAGSPKKAVRESSASSSGATSLKVPTSLEDAFQMSRNPAFSSRTTSSSLVLNPSKVTKSDTLKPTLLVESSDELGNAMKNGPKTPRASKAAARRSPAKKKSPKTPPSKIHVKRESDDDSSPFSSENIFQTGSLKKQGKRSLDLSPDSPKRLSKKTRPEDTPPARSEYNAVPNADPDFIRPPEQVVSPANDRQTLEPVLWTPPPPTKSARKPRQSFMPEISKLNVSKKFIDMSSPYKMPDAITASLESPSSSNSFMAARDSLDQLDTSFQTAPPVNVSELTPQFGGDTETITVQASPTSTSSDFSPLADLWLVLNVLAKAALAVFISSVVLFGLWYRQQSIEIGYCNAGYLTRGSEYFSPETEKYLDALRPLCSPCPDHAICFPNSIVQCERDYVLESPLLSFNGLIPLTPSCQQDRRKQDRVSIVVHRVKQLLNERNAEYLCSSTQESSEMTADEVKAILAEKRSSYISDEEFDDIWTDVVERLEDNSDDSDIVIKSVYSHITNVNTGVEERVRGIVLKSTSLDEAPLLCRQRIRLFKALSLVKVHLNEKWEKHKSIIITISLGVIAVAATVASRSFSHYRQKQTLLVIDSIIELLRAQARASDSDFTGLTERFIRLPVLREKILEHGKSAYCNLALEAVEQNPSVRRREQDIEGDIFASLEWIGA